MTRKQKCYILLTVIKMFFDTPNNEIRILSVFRVQRDESHALSPDRPFHSLSLRRHGYADFTAGSRVRRVSPGDVLYLPAHFSFRIDAGKEDLFVVHFDLLNGSFNDMEVFSASDSRMILHGFERMYDEWHTKKPSSHYLCQAELCKLLACILSYKQTEINDFSENNFAETIEYIHMHFADKDLKVETLAKIAGMSDTYYRKLFAQKHRTTPLKYIHSLRLALAKELLTSGYYTVTETANKCGFDSQNYFSAVIKKAFGKTPSELKTLQTPHKTV